MPLLFVATQCLSLAKWLLYSHTKGRKGSPNPPHSLVDLQTFDDANRGPRGSLQLLFKNPTAMFGTCGSIIIILAVAMDPFFQQLVRYPRVRRSTDIAHVGKSVNCTESSTNSYFPDGAVDKSSLGNLPDRYIPKAIYAGIFGDSTQVKPDCVSGNYDFDPVESLALCSHCVTDTGHVTDTSYTSPSNPSWPLNLDNPSAANNAGVWAPDANVSIAGMKSPLAGFARFPPLVNSDSTRDGNFGGPTTCTECALYFCVNTYDISTRSGSTSSTLTSSWTSDTHRNRHDDVILNSPQDQRPHTLRVVQAPFFVAQPSQLSQYLTRQLRTTPGPPSDLLAQVSMAHDVTSMTADVATSVSAALMNKNRDVETGLGGSTTLQTGIDWGMETIIIAHWEWLSLHVLLILLSIIFLWRSGRLPNTLARPFRRSGNRRFSGLCFLA